MSDGKKTALVTGVAGFIGSHLAEALLAADCRVIGVDNLSTGEVANIASFEKNPSFSFIRADVVHPLVVEGSVDFVFHFASPASVIDYQNLPEETAMVNSQGTINMLTLSRQKNARFLFASTSEVYGDPLEHPQKETYWGNVNPNGVRACYDESKRFGEAITLVYHRKYALDTRIVRIFNTYGPRMRKTDGRVVSNFINQALEGKPITVYGDGMQTRSFTYVSDLITGIMKLMFVDAANGHVVNLGNPEEYTMIDFAKKIVSMTNSRSGIIHQELPKDDPVRRKPDISKALSLLRWAPVVAIDEGLTKTIEYYRHTS